MSIPEIKFSPELETFVENKRAEIKQKILSSEYPLPIEDLASLAWEYMEQNYPIEMKNIDLLEAIHALSLEVSELIFNEKLFQHDWVSNHEGGWIPRYKAK